jgi:hypothetical protein
MPNGQVRLIATLTIVRYPLWAVPFAIISMGLFRLPLWLNKKIAFYKLMGSGRNGTFDKTPDWRQWAVLTVEPSTVDRQPFTDYESPLTVSDLRSTFDGKRSTTPGSFILGYWKFCRCTRTTFILEPIEGHGLWDGKEAFGPLPKQTDYDGEIAILTRATIRLNRLKNFWSHVDGVASQMATAKGFITSYGIGEVPFIKQATFSIWQSKEHMKNFAYKMKDHAEVIRKTHKEQWYSEEMFVRFKVLARIEE